MNYSRYIKTSGQIDALYDFPNEEAMQLNVTENRDFVDGVWDKETYYVENGEAVARPASAATANKSSILADGLDEYIVSNIVPGSTVRLDGPISDQWTEQTSSVAITINVPGVYRVVIDQFPTQDFVSDINAS